MCFAASITLVLRSRFFLCALATALLWWLAMQRIGFFALGWIAFVPLLLAAGEISSLRSRFFYGWAAGVLCLALHNWWMLPTITKAAGVIGASSAAGALLGVLAVTLTAIIHGAAVAAMAALWNPRARYFRRLPLLLPLCVAAWWWLFEWGRAAGELAHSWGAPAFSQWRDAALLQSAFVFGQHGLSALCVWFAASLALWLRREYSARTPLLWRVPVAVFLVLHIWGAWRIRQYDQAPHEKLRVLLVATNVSSLNKNRNGETHFSAAWRATENYFQNSNLQNSNFQKPDVIAWPETTVALGHVTGGAQQRRILETLSRNLETPIVVGAQTFGRGGVLSQASLSNAAVAFAPDGSTQSSGKVRVVPFGERAPFQKWLPFLSAFAARPPVVPATQIAPLTISTRRGLLKLGTLICFESCFEHPAQTLVAQGAGVLLVLTNDEWLAGTTAPWEHAAMSAVRAAQSGTPVAQCANGGYALGTDARGRFLYSPQFAPAQALLVEIPLDK
jgi:apolipoprotein N-acyltransferase